jgi:hypothetical protein
MTPCHGPALRNNILMMFVLCRRMLNFNLYRIADFTSFRA